MFSYDQVMAAVAEAVEPLDGGQSQDYAALNILERIRGTPHPSIADKTARIMQFPRLKGRASLVADPTGVGAPAIDLFQQAELEPLRALIHEVAIGHRTKAKTEEFLNGIWLAFCRCSFR